MSTLQTWARIFCAFTTGVVLACLPFANVRADIVAHPVVGMTRSDDLHSAVTRDWSFWFGGYAVEHQHMTNTVNIAVSYVLEENLSTRDAADFTSLLDRITESLTQYPNEDDYWEVVNRTLTQTLLQEHPEFRSLTVALEVLPRTTIPYSCTSTVTATAQGQLREAWQLLSKNNSVHHQGREQVDVSAAYTYEQGISDRDYPDFVLIQRDLAEELATYPTASDSWEIVNRKLADAILAKHTQLTEVAVEIEAMPTVKLPYTYSTSLSLSRQPAA